jgi:hypothetical protein
MALMAVALMAAATAGMRTWLAEDARGVDRRHDDQCERRWGPGYHYGADYQTCLPPGVSP